MLITYLTKSVIISHENFWRNPTIQLIYFTFSQNDLENILYVYRNHHEQFDKFSFYIGPSTLEVNGLKV